jgi:hypothetical protein
LVQLSGFAGKHQDEGAQVVSQLTEMAEVAADLEGRLKEIGSQMNF